MSAFSSVTFELNMERNAFRRFPLLALTLAGNVVRPLRSLGIRSGMLDVGAVGGWKCSEIGDTVPHVDSELKLLEILVDCFKTH